MSFNTDFENIIPWNGQNDTGKDVRLKWQRNLEKIAANFKEVDNSYLHGDVDSNVKALFDFINGIKIAGTLIEYDSENKAIKINGSLYTTGGLAALGAGADGKGSSSAIADLVDVLITSLSNGDKLRYDGTRWINIHATDALMNAAGIIIETPEQWKARVPVSSRRQGMEVMLRTNSTDNTYTRYQLKDGVEDTDLQPIEYFVSITPYLVQEVGTGATDKAPSAALLDNIFNNYIMKIDGGTYDE